MRWLVVLAASNFSGRLSPQQYVVSRRMYNSGCKSQRSGCSDAVRLRNWACQTGRDGTIIGVMDTPNSLDQMPVLSRTALRHEVVRRLLAAIFRGELTEGTRLVAQKLATRFGISTTPIREALLELEAVGVVEFPHNRGAVVKAFGPRQLREIYHLRRILETEATRCACGHLDPAALEDLRRETSGLLENPEQRRLVRNGHGRRPDAARDGLPTVAATHGCGDEIRRYNTLVQTTREVVGNRHKVQTQAMLEHLPIVDALLAGQAELAGGHMARHVDSTATAVEAIMFPDEHP